MLTATYSPDDNKLRLYSYDQLDEELYARVKGAGFKWAPKQGLFVAPRWTPAREDFLIELCGEIGDEDTSLVERASERSERFDGYGEKRRDEAGAAVKAVDAIAERFEAGQPILVGHHSEARARREAEKLEAGMRKAVRLWDTSDYWERRSAAALRHAQYRLSVGVRRRRISTLAAERRKAATTGTKSVDFLKMWRTLPMTQENALRLANVDHALTSVWFRLEYEGLTAQDAAEEACVAHSRIIEWQTRWEAHFERRIAYEQAMLGIGFDLDSVVFARGGQVKVDGGACLIRAIYKGRDGSISSLALHGLRGRVAVERVEAYEPPEEGAEKVVARKMPPIWNYPQDGALELTAAEWKRMCAAYKAVKRAPDGSYRYRIAMRGYELRSVFLTDRKVVGGRQVAA